MENHHFQWENPLFLWSFSIAMLNYQRVWMVETLGIFGRPLDGSHASETAHGVSWDEAGLNIPLGAQTKTLGKPLGKP